MPLRCPHAEPPPRPARPRHPPPAQVARARRRADRARPRRGAGTAPSTASLPTRATRRFARAAGRHGHRPRLPVVRPHAAAARRRTAPSTTCTAAASWRRSTPSTCATPPGWPTRLGARVVMPDYPLAPGAHLARLPRRAGRDAAPRASATDGGAVARRRLRRRRARAGPRGCRCATAAAAAPPTHLVMHAPWVDLTTSTPETAAADAIDPWLFIGKLHAYAGWWAGSARRPRPPRGLPRPRRPGRPAARR